MESVIIAGGTGLVGTLLSESLSRKGYEVSILTRSHKSDSSHYKHIRWNPDKDLINYWPGGVEHVINLAGAGIADKRWTKTRKRSIRDSRILSTRLLVDQLKDAKVRVKNFVSASAIGYYGDGGDILLTEDMKPVTSEFLSDVCRQWEMEALKAQESVDSMTILRIGTVLSRQGGALEKMAKTIPLGVANYLGTGQQYVSWIHEADLCNMIIFSIENNLTGIFNAVAPETLRNKEFTKTLAHIINPSALLVPVPSIAVRAVFGELSRLVLNSSKVSAKKIMKQGFKFQYPELKDALISLYRK